MRKKLAPKEKLVILIIVSILSLIYYGLFQPQRGHFIDALQNSKGFDTYKPNVNFERSLDTTTVELF